jgi:hypothetical protein
MANMTGHDMATAQLEQQRARLGDPRDEISKLDAEHHAGMAAGGCSSRARARGACQATPHNRGTTPERCQPAQDRRAGSPPSPPPSVGV